MKSLWYNFLKNNLRKKMLQLNKRILMSAVALLLVCGVGLQGVALARDGSDNSGSGSSSSGSGGDGSDDKVATTSATETETETETHDQKTSTLTQQFRKEGQAKLKTEAKQRSTEQRKKSCEARKTALTKRMDNAVTHAEKHKAVFDKIYTKVKDFHDTKKLNVSNYDELTVAVDTAQADATAKITALKSLDVTVDCTQVDSLTTNVSAFREAVKSTRDSLKDYRKSIVELIKALKSASTSADKSSDSSDDSSSSTNTEAQ
jgi:chromosome segregation ATPase